MEKTRDIAALVHNSDRGRELAWPRLPSSDHLAIRHPERRHGVENLAPDPCLDSLCRQPRPVPKLGPFEIDHKSAA